nr:T9SS type A sorting domain-containing protein [Flavobacteriales bacterium]MBP9081357.1 T9SS type A sorting domain-containing protein [Flavobacteriales bacterium]
RTDVLQARVDQCCAATDPGLAPQDGAAPKQGTGSGELQDQRLQIIPNPVAELTTLAYHVPKAGRVVLQVSTLDGKPLATLREEMAEPGAYQYTWNTSKLAAGTYLCTFLLDDAVVMQRAVKVAR